MSVADCIDCEDITLPDGASSIEPMGPFLAKQGPG